MEVHHHPNIEKKKFKEYFLEFLMIFLAVTMGFFAENIREDISNDRKENRIIQELLVDIKSDSSKIESAIKGYTARLKLIDTFIDLIFRKPRTDSNMKLMYFLYADRATKYLPVSFTKRIFNELKTTDLFGLIRNQKVVDSINSYQEKTDLAETQINTNFKSLFLTESIQFSYNVFDWQYLLDDTAANDHRWILSSSQHFHLLPNGEAYLKQYGGRIIAGRGVQSREINMLQEAKRSAINLIGLLKEEYGLREP